VYPLTWEIMIDNVFLDDEKLPLSTLTPSSIGLSALIDTVRDIILLITHSRYHSLVRGILCSVVLQMSFYTSSNGWALKVSSVAGTHTFYLLKLGESCSQSTLETSRHQLMRMRPIYASQMWYPLIHPKSAVSCSVGVWGCHF
jgi:hypothetical protein